MARKVVADDVFLGERHADAEGEHARGPRGEELLAHAFEVVAVRRTGQGHRDRAFVEEAVLGVVDRVALDHGAGADMFVALVALVPDRRGVR